MKPLTKRIPAFYNPLCAPDKEHRLNFDRSNGRARSLNKKRGRAKTWLPAKEIAHRIIQAGRNNSLMSMANDMPNEESFLLLANNQLMGGLHRHNDTMSKPTNISLAKYSVDDSAAKIVKRLKRTLSEKNGEITKGVDCGSEDQGCLHALREKTYDGFAMHKENNDQILIDLDKMDDQPLLMWFKDIQSPTNGDCSRDVAAQDQFANKTHEEHCLDTFSPVATIKKPAEDQCANASDENHCFESCSVISTKEKPCYESPSVVSTRDAIELSTFTTDPIAIGNSIELPPLQEIITIEPKSDVLLGEGASQCTESDGSAMELGTLSFVRSDSVDNNQDLPFAKCSPVWETIDSMKIFRKMPQKPHFFPLLEKLEETREGYAIAKMVTFSNIVEKISNLQFSDDSRVVRRILVILADLEYHGFEVKATQERLRQLLSMHERGLELQGMRKEIQDKITTSTLKSAKLDEDIKDIELKIKELERKICTPQSTKEMKEQEIFNLQLKLDGVSEKVKGIQHDFESVVGSPW